MFYCLFSLISQVSKLEMTEGKADSPGVVAGRKTVMNFPNFSLCSIFLIL